MNPIEKGVVCHDYRNLRKTNDNNEKNIADESNEQKPFSKKLQILGLS